MSLTAFSEPFLTTKSSGTGLGLAITKRIVAAHEGSMFVESFPGGSMFHVLLPLWKRGLNGSISFSC